MESSTEKFDQPGRNYRALVERRKLEREERNARNLRIQRIVAVMQIPVCISFILFSIDTYARSIASVDTVQAVALTAGLTVSQVCGWAYIVLFPRFYRSLRQPEKEGTNQE